MKKMNDQVGGYISRTTETQGHSTIKRYIVSAALGFLAFLVAMLILSLSGALIISKSSDSTKLIPFVSTVSMTVSALLGGIVCAKKSGSSALFSSLIFLSTVGLSVVLMTLIFLKDSHDAPLWQDLLLKIPVMLGAIFGGFIGNIKKKPKSLYDKYK